MFQTKTGVRVSCRDGWAGKLKRLLVDPATGRTTHLVIEIVSLSPLDALVPVEHVIATGHEAIFLDLTSAQLEVYRERG